MAFINPLDKAAGVALSNNNLSFSAAASTMARTDEPIVGKIYIEIKITNGYYGVVGFTSKDAPLTGAIWGDSNSVTYGGDGAIRVNGNHYSATPVPNNGVVGIVVDIPNKTYAFYNNGTLVRSGTYSNPANKSLYFMVGAHSSTATGTITVTNPYSYTVPVGYTNYLKSTKFLVQLKLNNQYLYLNQSSQWTVLPNAPTNQDFINYGMDTITAQIQQSLEAQYGKQYRFLLWTAGKLYIKAVQKAVPNPQLIHPNGDISLVNVETIDSLLLTATGNTKVAISFDSGLTWQAHDGTSWNTVADASNGMTVAQLNALTSAMLDGARNGSNFIRFSYWLGDETASIDKIKMVVTMKGYEQLANTKDYNVSYDQATKTLSYTINKNGTYTVNYVDTPLG